MRKIWFTFLFIFAIVSCDRIENTVVDNRQEELLFHFSKFDIIEGAGIDMNDDGVINTNILKELYASNYFSTPRRRDMELRVSLDHNNPWSIVTFTFPEVQTSSYDGGFLGIQSSSLHTLYFKKGTETDTEMILDSGLKVLSFKKITDTRYRLIMEKSYFNYATNAKESRKFEVEYFEYQR